VPFGMLAPRRKSGIARHWRWEGPFLSVGPVDEAKEPEWNNKSTKVSIIAGRRPDKCLQRDKLFHFDY
jgi:hypothetical protein